MAELLQRVFFCSTAGSGCTSNAIGLKKQRHLLFVLFNLWYGNQFKHIYIRSKLHDFGGSNSSFEVNKRRDAVFYRNSYIKNKYIGQKFKSTDADVFLTSFQPLGILRNLFSLTENSSNSFSVLPLLMMNYVHQCLFSCGG